VIKAFASLRNLRAKLVIHSQQNLEDFFPELRDLIGDLERRKVLICHKRTVPAPGLYHLGDVYVYPSRLDGIGLTVAEALSCGLPVITSDNPPMNEFVNGTNGKVIKIDRLFARSDGYYWPQCSVNLGSLRECMQEYADHPETIKENKILARNYAEKHLYWTKNGNVLPTIFEQVMYLSNKDKKTAICKAQLFEEKRKTFKVKFYYNFPSLYKILKIPHRILKRYPKTFAHR
jgi:glycosyltransferase involved in cell wall biosynthesis